MMPLLEIRDLMVLYGEIEALRGVSLSVDEGQVVTLLGANGAGKSTTLRAISGLAKPAAGFSRPEIARSVVDLPAPLAPSKVTTCPASTVSEMPRKASISP